jgi:hypothetical protein
MATANLQSINTEEWSTQYDYNREQQPTDTRVGESR